MKKLMTIIAAALIIVPLHAQKVKTYTVTSPDGKVTTEVTVGNRTTYTVKKNGKEIIAASPISMTILDGPVWCENARVKKAKSETINETFASPFYRSMQMTDNCNQLTLDFQGDYSLQFRAYNEGVAYRFTTAKKKPFIIENEEVAFNFPKDDNVVVPYVREDRGDTYEKQFFNSFENTNTKCKLSEMKDRLAFLPLIVSSNGEKVCITEANIEAYPGLYLVNKDKSTTLRGVHALYPKTWEQGGHNRLQMVVQERENYIAKIDGARNFPWRIAIIGNDVDIAQSSLNYILGEPSRIEDTSWIKPGKVAWDWWNAWNIYGVDFKADINNDTYKYYIDFASEHGIEYVILDEGWAVNLQADLMQIVPEIDLKELIAYADKKNVGLILWAGYWAFDRDMENVCRHYSEMGIKGFKVDFMDRDDQLMTDFNYRAAAMAAKYKLVLDFHGSHKPAGINRTWPNVLNAEGVHGLEQMKWVKADVDQLEYDCEIPFTRQVGGPMDYTQGAMINAAVGKYRPDYEEPMSQGTRCHQLALYMIFDSPINMLCDSPSNYKKEKECTDFIASVPTSWDETRVLCGEVGKYIVTARRKGDTWFIGGITNKEAREVEVDASFLPKGAKVTAFIDGPNAYRKGCDYLRYDLNLNNLGKVKVKMQPGGGFAAVVRK